MGGEVMKHKDFKESIASARQAFSAGKVPSEGDFGGLISAVENAGFSRGMIMMFSGTKDDKPDGWAWCDGTTTGVPDLTGRFIIGDTIDNAGSRAGNKKSLPFDFGAGTFDVTSGSVTATLKGKTSDTKLRVEHLPSHNHEEGLQWEPRYQQRYDVISNRFPGSVKFGHESADMASQGGRSVEEYRPVLDFIYYVDEREKGRDGQDIFLHNERIYTSSTGSERGHGHDIDGDVTITIRDKMKAAPPYYALAFIMKL